MSVLVTDIRQLRKQRATTSVETPSAEVVPTPVITDEHTLGVLSRMSPLDSKLVQMMQKNPALGLLIETLDLEPVRAELPPGHARLWDLAGQALEGGQLYSRAEAIERIKIKTAVTLERAERGFTLMLESKAIEPAVDADNLALNPNLFYLGGSTPF